MFKLLRRKFHCNMFRLEKVAPNNLKGKKHSSQLWLTRQLQDPYVEKAKMMNYRCRSAFKLTEIDDQANILKPGQIVVDCGAAPGSWTQVAVNRTNADAHDDNQPTGKVISIDRLPMYPIEGAHLLANSDFRETEVQNKIIELLSGKKVDVVLSDMAPNASGVRSLDQENIILLCYAVVRFAVQLSKINASLLIKVWDGGEVPTLEKDIKQFYKKVKFIKPNSSRSDSAEKFILAREFRGLKA